MTGQCSRFAGRGTQARFEAKLRRRPSSVRRIQAVAVASLTPANGKSVASEVVHSGSRAGPVGW